MDTFFIKQLKKIMLENGLTQKELANKLKVTNVFVSNYLKGKRNPKPATIHKIAKALNMPPSFFIEGQKNFENSGIIGNNNSNNFNGDMKDIKIQLQDHEIRLLKLENEILKKKIK